VEFVASGVPHLDAMLGGRGYYRGSSVLVSGASGTGKSTLAAHFASAACERGEVCLYFAFEESPSQIRRNMQSVGLDLTRAVESGMLRFFAQRPTAHGLEMHLALMHKAIVDNRPKAIIVDPITNFVRGGSIQDATNMLVRLVDHLKTSQITALFTDLNHGDPLVDGSESLLSSVMDTWLLLRAIESDGERNRVLAVIKSRGTGHSNQVREFRLTDSGLSLLDVPARALRQRALERKRMALEAQILSLQAELAEDENAMARFLGEAGPRAHSTPEAHAAMAQLRWADDARPDAARTTSPKRRGDRSRGVST
jgi:circadian clock protein KaiC